MCLTREKEIIILYTRAHAFQGTGHGEDTPDQPRRSVHCGGPALSCLSALQGSSSGCRTDVRTSLPVNQRSRLQRKRRLLQPAGIAIVFTARVLETHRLPGSPTPPCGRCVFAEARDLLRFCPRHLPQRRACALASAGRADLVPPAECPAWFLWNWVLRDPPFLPSPPDPPDPCGPSEDQLSELRGGSWRVLVPALRRRLCACGPDPGVPPMAGPRVEVDGGVLEGVSAGQRPWGGSVVREALWSHVPFSLRPAPWAGWPDPEGVHGPELSPGRALARAEDPSRPQHAGPAVIGRWGRGLGTGGGGGYRDRPRKTALGPWGGRGAGDSGAPAVMLRR